jgi:hypothetical protein
VPDEGRELEHGEERREQDAYKMELDADLVYVKVLVVVALAGGGTVAWGSTAEDGEVEVLEAG